MQVSNLELEGLKLITPDKFHDHRGFFLERYNSQKLSDLGLPASFVQDNFSHSLPGVIRGLHYQTDPRQGKLVGVVYGRILDVAVDIRYNSATYGKHIVYELNSESMQMLWIPGGFAHGFYVLGDQPAGVLYKTDAFYNPQTDSGIKWDDPTLSIKWPIKNPIISGKDAKLPPFLSCKQL